MVGKRNKALAMMGFAKAGSKVEVLIDRVIDQNETSLPIDDYHDFVSLEGNDRARAERSGKVSHSLPFSYLVSHSLILSLCVRSFVRARACVPVFVILDSPFPSLPPSRSLAVGRALRQEGRDELRGQDHPQDLASRGAPRGGREDSRKAREERQAASRGAVRRLR